MGRLEKTALLLCILLQLHCSVDAISCVVGVFDSCLDDLFRTLEVHTECEKCGIQETLIFINGISSIKTEYTCTTECFATTTEDGEIRTGGYCCQTDFCNFEWPCKVYAGKASANGTTTTRSLSELLYGARQVADSHVYQEQSEVTTSTPLPCSTPAEPTEVQTPMFLGRPLHTNSTKQELLTKARLAEKLSRFDDMALFMRQVMELSEELSTEEITLLAKAFTITARYLMLSWKDLYFNEDPDSALSEYRHNLYSEFFEIATPYSTFLAQQNPETVAEKMHLWKLKGAFKQLNDEMDSHIVKFNNRSMEEKLTASGSRKIYEEALSFVQRNLRASHAERLALIIDFSKMYVDVYNEVESACELAISAYNDAMMDLDGSNEEADEVTAENLQTIGDRIKLWKCFPADHEKDIEEPEVVQTTSSPSSHPCKESKTKVAEPIFFRTSQLSDNAEELLRDARIAEKTKRFEDVPHFMKKLMELGEKIPERDEHLLFTSFKRAINSRMDSRHLFTVLTQYEKSPVDKSYMEHVQNELYEICNAMVSYLDDILIPTESDSAVKAGYLKLKGDYLRYTAEVEKNREIAHSSETSYQEALATAEEVSHFTPYLRLSIENGLSLLYADFDWLEKACRTAKAAYAAAMSTTPEDHMYIDFKSIELLQKMRKRMLRWECEGVVHEEKLPEDDYQEQVDTTTASADTNEVHNKTTWTIDIVGAQHNCTCQCKENNEERNNDESSPSTTSRPSTGHPRLSRTSPLPDHDSDLKLKTSTGSSTNAYDSVPPEIPNTSDPSTTSEAAVKSSSFSQKKSAPERYLQVDDAALQTSEISKNMIGSFFIIITIVNVFRVL